jgi:hypothetical protein
MALRKYFLCHRRTDCRDVLLSLAGAARALSGLFKLKMSNGIQPMMMAL